MASPVSVAAERATGVTIRSAFQPLLSASHRRVVGFEALARPRDARGRPVSYGELSLTGETADQLERDCCRAHVEAFVRERPEPAWLFLNVDPSRVMGPRGFGEFFAALLAEHGLSPNRVVVEILEVPASDEFLVAEAVQLFRDLGCLVAIDDVGAGHSNFERVWRAAPDIVKLDRVIAVASQEGRVRRVLPGFVSVFHEVGCLVVMEGIETEAQAAAALDADVDFLQGFYFARPADHCHPAREGTDRIARLDARLHERQIARATREKSRLESYARRLARVAKALQGDLRPAEACSALLALPAVDRCYVLDETGRQIGPNLEARLNPEDARYEPVADATSANWSRRPYFRRAVAEPGSVQMTRPYLSIRDRRLCVTLSFAFRYGGTVRVVCADLGWDRVLSVPPPADG